MSISRLLACIAITTFISSTHPGIARSQSPVQLDVDSFINTPEYQYGSDYYCYRVHSGGYLENLNYLCEKELPKPPEPPAILSNGRIECRFLGSVSSEVLLGKGASISIPALCVALDTLENVVVSSQLLADGRLLGDHREPISYMVQGDSYAFDAEFTTDYAPRVGADFSLRFIP